MFHGWVTHARDLTGIILREDSAPEGHLSSGAGLDIKRIPSTSDRLKFRISVLFGFWKEGDHRDWDAIRAWAGSLRSLMGS